MMSQLILHHQIVEVLFNIRTLITEQLDQIFILR